MQVKATSWFLVCAVLQRGISTITTPIFTRLLSTGEYGQFSTFNSWLSLIQIIVTLQLCSGVYTMGIVKFKEDEKIFTSSLQGLNLVLCLAWMAIYLLFKDFWNEIFSLTTVQMLAMLLMIWAGTAFNFWMTTQRNCYRYRSLVIVTLIVSVLKPLVGIVFVVLAEDKVTARILGLALVEAICYSGFFFLQMREGKRFFSAKYWKYAFFFNLPLLPHYLANTILASSDRIMIQKIVGDSAAGIYGLAYSIALVMTLVNDALNKVMSPWLYQKVREKDYHNMSRMVYPCLILVAAANLFLIAVAPEVVAIFAPAEYMEAIYVIPPVAMSALASYMYLCFAPFEFYFEKRSWTTISTFTSAVVNIVLNYIFIQRVGYQAAGYTTLFCTALNALLHYYFMRKVCRTYLDNVKPYNPKILLVIGGVFMGIGFLYISLYSHILGRYSFTLLFAFIMFLQRKKLFLTFNELLKK